MSFEGKTIWITGASSGIGAALANEWSDRGANIILSGRDKGRLAEVASSLSANTLTLPFDVRDDAALADAVAKATAWNGNVDVFVANAGVSQRSQAIHTDMQVYRDIIDIDLTAQIAATQALLGHMVERESGKFVFISSIAGKVGAPMRTAYSAAKFGLIGYADALRAEMSAKGVDVHVVAPGSIATDVSRNALTADGSKRNKSDDLIDNGIPPAEAAKTMIDAIAAGQREIIVASGIEMAMGEMRRTPDELFDQIAAMVAGGYMEKLEAEG